MKKHKLCELVLDWDLYPRRQVNSQHANYILEAIRASAEMPPIIIDRRSKRVVDGFHRHRAFSKAFGEEHEVECIEKTYKSDGELFLDAMRYNAAHGQVLNTFDRTHCILKSEELKIEPDQVASALHITTDKLGELRTDRVGEIISLGQKTPLKRTIKHMAGQKLTDRQSEANQKLSGLDQKFYVNQLIELLEADLINWDDVKLVERLSELRGLLAANERVAA